jgi:hypothetical protein
VYQLQLLLFTKAWFDRPKLKKNREKPVPKVRVVAAKDFKILDG